MSSFVISPSNSLKNVQNIVAIDAKLVFFINQQISSINNAIYGYQPTYDELKNNTINVISLDTGLCADVYRLDIRASEIEDRVSTLCNFAKQPFRKLNDWTELSNQWDPFCVYLIPLDGISLKEPFARDGDPDDTVPGTSINIVNDCAELIYVIEDGYNEISAYNEETRLSGGHWECIGTTSFKNEEIQNLVDTSVNNLSVNLTRTINDLSAELKEDISNLSSEIKNDISNLSVEFTDTISSISTDLSNAISTLDDSLSNYLPLSGFKTITGLVSSDYEGYLYVDAYFMPSTTIYRGIEEMHFYISSDSDPIHKYINNRSNVSVEFEIENLKLVSEVGFNDGEHPCIVKLGILIDKNNYKIDGGGINQDGNEYIYARIPADNVHISIYSISSLINGNEYYGNITDDYSSFDIELIKTKDGNLIFKPNFDGRIRIQTEYPDDSLVGSFDFYDNLNYNVEIFNNDDISFDPDRPPIIKNPKTGYFTTDSDLDNLNTIINNTIDENVQILSNGLIDLSSQAFIQRAKMALEDPEYAFPFDIYELSDGTILTSDLMHGSGQILNKEYIDRGAVRISIGTRSNNIPETVSLDAPIDERCVYANNTVRSVTIPASLKYVYACLFGKFTALSHVVVDDECTTIIGANNLINSCGQFYGCSSLQELNLKNCKINSYNSFEGCTNLRKISSFRIIGGTFTNCSNLTEIDCPDTGYLKLDGCTSFKNYSKFDNAKHSGEYVFGDSGLTSFNVNYANIHPTRPEYNSGARFDFSNSNIEKLFVNAPYIGHRNSINNVFAEAEKLKEIDCRNLSTTIKYSSTSGSRLRINLNQDQYLIVPDSLYDDFINDPQYWYTPTSNVIKVSDWDYVRHYELSNLTDELHNWASDTFVPKTTTVNNKALSGNVSLDASDVGAIPSEMSGDFALTSDLSAYEPSHKLTYLWFDDGTMSSYNWFGEISQQTMIDAGLYDIDEGWTKTVTKADIGTNVTNIAEYAFSACSDLTSVTVPNSVTRIGEGVFYKCHSLTSITISNSVTRLDAGAFSNCSSLTFVTIPDSVEYIGGGAFIDCSSLTALIFEDKTLATVQGMENYPWDVDSLIISAWNDASQEWVNEQGFLTEHQSLTGFVPKTTTVNDKALSSNIVLNATDVSAIPASKESAFALTSTTVNGQELSGNVTLYGTDISVGGNTLLSDYTIEKALSSLDNRIENLDLAEYVKKADLSIAIVSALSIGTGESGYDYMTAGSDYTPITISAAIDWNRKLHQAFINMLNLIAPL